MKTKQDYYDTLGISKDADDASIKRAYRKMAKKYHPDMNQGDPNAEQKFKEVTEAYNVLSDKEKKKLYDQFGSAAFEEGFDPAARNFTIPVAMHRGCMVIFLIIFLVAKAVLADTLVLVTVHRGTVAMEKPGIQVMVDHGMWAAIMADRAFLTPMKMPVGNQVRMRGRTFRSLLTKQCMDVTRSLLCRMESAVRAERCMCTYRQVLTMAIAFA